MISISAQCRVPTIIGQLTGHGQVTKKTLPLEELTSEAGVASLLREVDMKFGFGTVTLLHNNISDFFGYNCEKQMSVEEFVAGSNSGLDKIRKLNINKELKSIWSWNRQISTAVTAIWSQELKEVTALSWNLLLTYAVPSVRKNSLLRQCTTTVHHMATRFTQPEAQLQKTQTQGD